MGQRAQALGVKISRRGRTGSWRLAVLGLLTICFMGEPPSTQTARPVV